VKSVDGNGAVGIPKGFTEHFIQVDGYRWRYLRGGSGAPLLLIHGLMGYSFSWREVAPALARNYDVIAPDMLNLGFSERAPVDAGLGGIAERMWKFADALGLKRLTLLGSSQGGAIAMKMAVVARERVFSLILVSPAHPWSEKARWQIRLFSTPLGAPIAWAMSIAPRSWMALGLYRLYSDFANMPAGTIPGYSRPIDRRMLAYLLRVARRWNEDFDELKQEIGTIADIPTLLIWGDRDSIVPVSTIEDLHACFRRVAIEIIPGAGHLPYEEKPEEFLTAFEQGRRTLEMTHV
jgi:pimeloyl-ACP methyl ester carboxylesterase